LPELVELHVVTIDRAAVSPARTAALAAQFR